MYFCPFCGTKVKTEENYCLNCGKKLPEDLSKRVDTSKQQFNRLWLLPLTLIVIFIIVFISLYFHTNKQTDRALAYYEKSQDQIFEYDYHQAKESLKRAIDLKPNFEHALVALEFTETALQIQEQIKKAQEFSESQEFSEALSLINEAERNLRSFHGENVNHLIDELSNERYGIKFASLTASLEEQPSIDELKVLLWEAEGIKTDEAEKVSETIRKQIADYTYSKAVDLLNKHQFSDAKLLVSDGLKYATNSKKLHSLQKTIEKEKEAFETKQQERIEQAIHLAEEERALNEMDAVELVEVKIKEKDKDELTIVGEVKSLATIPIHSVIVEYSLFHQKDDKPYVKNKAFIYPDTLYPGDTGKFEFTHYDIENEVNISNVQVDKFTWYTN